MMDPAMDMDIADCDFLSDIGDSDGNDSHDEFSSDPEIDKYYVHCITCRNRLFGRQRPLHLVIGGGLAADVILWRNKETSACVLAGATVVWLLIEWIGYQFLTILCNALLLTFTSLFLWSNLASYTNFVSPPELPNITLPEGSLVRPALLLRWEYLRALRTFGEVIFGADLKRFFKMVGTLWILSVSGSRFNLLTLFYLVTVILLTVPMLYENFEDNVDSFAEKAFLEIRKKYAQLDQRVFQKLKKWH
ncbi:reticulon-like protein B2 [Humulus lupulus]|uniref:reticulon-like protein B2 n=1 Tax=Humulus lupulus TaxID=3486 RepID=UPI002B40A611|nr:reticulon-like protein B2 [Humulus lupulus]